MDLCFYSIVLFTSNHINNQNQTFKYYHLFICELAINKPGSISNCGEHSLSELSITEVAVKLRCMNTMHAFETGYLKACTWPNTK